jgi:hypothetical protein
MTAAKGSLEFGWALRVASHGANHHHNAKPPVRVFPRTALLADKSSSCSSSGSYQPYSVLDSRNDSERRSNSQKRRDVTWQGAATLLPPHFEHEHDDQHEHDLVADLGVSSVERYAALRLCGESSFWFGVRGAFLDR